MSFRWMPRSADRNLIQMKCKNYDRMIDLHSPAHGNITCRNKVFQFCKITGVEITNKSELISFIGPTTRPPYNCLGCFDCYSWRKRWRYLVRSCHHWHCHHFYSLLWHSDRPILDEENKLLWYCHTALRWEIIV